jgi:prepilin-type N-terminal cleavage/methylation domain-containing protein
MKVDIVDRCQRGYTLVEAIVVMSILTLVLTALGYFLVNVSKDMFWVTNKSIITHDVRSFTARISKEALSANCGYVYASISSSDRNSASDRRESGESGDCLVLISMDPYPDIHDDKHYTGLVVYYRLPDENGEGPVYRAEKSFSTPQSINVSSGVNHFEQFLAAQFPNFNTSGEVVLELSRGLANGNLFQNFGNNTFIVNGEILHGNTVKEVTNTYNLTISPRG